MTSEALGCSFLEPSLQASRKLPVERPRGRSPQPYGAAKLGAGPGGPPLAPGNLPLRALPDPSICKPDKHLSSQATAFPGGLLHREGPSRVRGHTASPWLLTGSCGPRLCYPPIDGAGRGGNQGQRLPKVCGRKAETHNKAFMSREGAFNFSANTGRRAERLTPWGRGHSTCLHAGSGAASLLSGSDGPHIKTRVVKISSISWQICFAIISSKLRYQMYFYVTASVSKMYVCMYVEGKDQIYIPSELWFGWALANIF